MSGSSETIELPDFLPYPDVLPLSEVPELNGKLAYIIKGYEDGIAANVLIQDDNICVRFGDWNGKQIDIQKAGELSKLANEFIGKYLDNTIRLFRTIGLSQALLYMGLREGKMQLVDVRLSLNKFVGPGMIRDLFSKIVPTQEVNKVVNIDDATLDAIQAGKGNFAGELTIKTSAFETVERQTPRGKSMFPLYATVTRKVVNAPKTTKKVPYMPKPR